jgi:hypothetical protein
MIMMDNPKKQQCPIEVTLFGIVIKDNKQQPENQRVSIEVTLFEMIIKDSHEQAEK